MTWLNAAVVLLVALVLASCGDRSPSEDTPSTAGPAETPAALQPASTPATSPATPAAAAAPGSLQPAVAYANGCGALASSFGSLDPIALMASGDDPTFGELAGVLDGAVIAFGLMEPPPELAPFHDAWLSFLSAYRDHAATRPATQSVAQVQLLFASAVLPKLVELANDTGRTDAEKQELGNDFIREQTAEIYGPDFAAAYLELLDAESDLPGPVRNVLEESGCSADSILGG